MLEYWSSEKNNESFRILVSWQCYITPTAHYSRCLVNIKIIIAKIPLAKKYNHVKLNLVPTSGNHHGWL